MCSGHTTIWLDCPTCGKPQRATKKVKHIPAKYFRLPNPQGVYEVQSETRDIMVSDVDYVQVTYTKKTGRQGYKMSPRGKCSVCGTVCMGRAINMTGSGQGLTKCGSACLKGQRDCDCHCGGRCHGAGTCHCVPKN